MVSPSISQRGLGTPESPIRKLAPYADEAKRNGIHIYHLNIGQPDILTPPEFHEAIQNYGEKVLAYGPSNGLPFFRENLVAYYHRNGYDHIAAPDVMVTTAGSEAVLFSMMAVASPGEEIITFEPFYPNYNGFAHMAGIRLVPVGTDPEAGYHLPPREAIVGKITPKTRAVLVCTPNNPTGTILTRREMDTIRDIAHEHNLFVLSDEVYREFTFDGVHTSILSYPDLAQHAVQMDSLSKRYSACGARVGCIVSKNTQLMETVLKFGQARLCPPSLEQVGAAAVVAEGDKYFKDMIAEYRCRRDTVCDELMSIPGVRCEKPEGAFYLMATFPVEDIEGFARWLLTDFHIDKETVMLAPGPGFYATPGMGRQEARIAYVLNTQDLKTSVRILQEGLNTYQKV